MWKRIAACILAAAVMAGTFCGTALAEPGEITPGWNRKGTDWYYYREDGSLLRNGDTPDGYRVDDGGKFAGTALGNGPWPVLETELLEEKAAQETEMARLYAIVHLSENPQRGIISQPVQRAAYVSIWDRENYAELRNAQPRTKLSGLSTGNMPMEFFMLSVAGETSGSPNLVNAIIGDRGRAYGPCQFDYRYDLVDFFRYAYGKHPQLWAGLAPYLSLQSGDVTLVQNAGIKKAFRTALLTDYRTTVSDQLEYMRMLYWDGLAAAMNTAGYHLGSRNVAISAALFSISVNCGPQPDVFIKGLDPSMSDPEMLDAIYRLRNTVFADQPLENRTKGTNDRYLIYEPEMAADLMFGRVNLDSWKIYGCGVEWYGNPF